MMTKDIRGARHQRKGPQVPWAASGPRPRCTCPWLEVYSCARPDGQGGEEKDSQEKEVVLEAENGRDAPANGNVNEESGEQKANNKVDEEEEEGREEEEGEGYGEEEAGDEEEETEAGGAQGQLKMMRKDDDVAAKMQKTHEDG
ncbi:prothymosin alpha-like [Ursus maritimus]|uniref:Prothymosin alpha n=1 Tax=Ursus maritimus TaxID=29073 RepID=A0A384BKH6_URSMA|nr:prothymosin alpha-like [Ursus maritimus]